MTFRSCECSQRLATGSLRSARESQRAAGSSIRRPSSGGRAWCGVNWKPPRVEEVRPSSARMGGVFGIARFSRTAQNAASCRAVEANGRSARAAADVSVARSDRPAVARPYRRFVRGLLILSLVISVVVIGPRTPLARWLEAPGAAAEWIRSHGPGGIVLAFAGMVAGLL